MSRLASFLIFSLLLVSIGNAQLATHNPDWKIIEKNNTWWRYSWKVTVANDYNTERRAIVRVKFLDFEGFVIDDDLAVETVPAFHYKEVTGSALIRVPKAEKVYRMTVDVR